jgi:hypothetical protein
MVMALRVHTDAVRGAIETAVSPILVGDGVTPKGAGWVNGAFTQYVTLFPRPEGRYSGTLGNPRMKKERVYQASCVGRSREQSEWLADKVSEILDTLVVSGHRVCRLEPESAPGTFRDPDTEPPVFVTPFLFRLTTTS